MLNFSKWKIAWVAFISLTAVLFAFPNFLTEEQAAGLPGWLPSDQINLGLDLQGGSYRLLEVQTEIAVVERQDNLLDEVRRELRSKKIRATGFVAGEYAFTFRLRDDAQRDDALKAVKGLAQQVVSNVQVVPVDDISVDVLDDGRIEVRLSDEGIIELRRNVVQQSVEVVRRRIDELGTREPTIQRQGTNRILVQVPGLKDPKALDMILKAEAKLTFHLVDQNTDAFDIEQGRIAPGSVVLPMSDGGQIAIRKRAMVTGENLERANATFDQFGAAAVGFRFDNVGGRKFGKATTENVGRPFAIVLDGEVISAPRINEPITGGSGIITGNFTVTEAQNLAVLLNAGALPVPLTTLEDRTIGATLGQDSIEAGGYAAIYGLVAVIAFIIITYGGFGLAANAALVINIFMIIGALTLFNATLTLPGIAGIVLTIGMAVDANVLVFERIREEVRLGKTPLAAVDNGYSQALSTIMDANITTFIAAIVLFQFGSGPVKGFAVTLAIGIVTSVFAAVTITRLFIAIWLRRSRPSTINV